jgi:hypothetical protein
MAPKNIKHCTEARGIKNAEWVAEMLAVGGTSASAGRTDNIVRYHISAYGLAKVIEGRYGTGDNTLTDFSSNISCR